MNNWYLSTSGEDSDKFEKEFKGKPDMIEKSWQYIFELDDVADPSWIAPREEKEIQAIFWKLELNFVKNVTWLEGTRN